MTLLDIYEQVKLVKPEVFPFYVEMQYVDREFSSTVFPCIFLDVDHDVFTYVTYGSIGIFNAWKSNKIELIFLDEMMDHYMNPKDEHQYKFSNKFNRLVK